MKGRFNLSRNRVRHYLGKREVSADQPDHTPEVAQSMNDFRTFWIQKIGGSEMYTGVESNLPPSFGSGWIEVREVKKEDE